MSTRPLFSDNRPMLQRCRALVWSVTTLAVAILPLWGCVTRATGPELPYVKPAYSEPSQNPNPDPAALHMSARLQDLEVEMQRLRDMVERLKAQPAAGNQEAIVRLQERVTFIERQLGMEGSADAGPKNATLQPPAPKVQPEPKPANPVATKPSKPVPGLDGEPPLEIVDNNAPSAEDKQYLEAYDLLRRGSTDESVGLFEDFLKRFPKSRLAADAMYWIGEARFASGRYDEAVLQFDRVIKEFPGSRKELNALLKQGLAFEKMGDQRSAKIIFQKLVQEKPHTPQARVAANRLKSLPPD
jgi:tol-pal system protein YbgF